MQKDKRVISIFILTVTALCNCAFNGHPSWNEPVGPQGVLSSADRGVWQRLVAEAERKPVQPGTDLTITYPYERAVFPPEIAAPTFRWTDRSTASTYWLVVFLFKDRQSPVYALADTQRWTPGKATWEAIKARSVAEYPGGRCEAPEVEGPITVCWCHD
jgi:hypothetical protein